MPSFVARLSNAVASVVIVAGLAVGGTATVAAQGSVARTDTLRLTGLQQPVEVLRDRWGIPRIYAKNEHDLFFAQGYSAARDRAFQFEMWRRQATGTMAEVLGRRELDRDHGARLFRYRDSMTAEMARYHPRGAAIIGAFVEGVNAYVDEAAHNPAVIPVELRMLGIKPARWTADVVISRHAGLLGNIGDELANGRFVAKHGAALLQKIQWFHPGPDAPVLTLDPMIDGAGLDAPILALYDAFRAPLRFQPSDLKVAYRGDSAAHRRLGVSIGHNEHGAWGLTIFATDGEDLYVYRTNPGNPAQYQYRGAWETMRTTTESVPVKGEAPVSVALRYTRHGPVVYEDTLRHLAYVVRAAWLEPGGAPYMASLRMDQAKSWEEFRAACSYSNIPGENMVWADVRGNIGWQAVGIAPIRPASSGLVPVPGDGRFD